MIPSICAHIPCNFFGESFCRLLRSLEWVDHCVLHDASDSNALAAGAKQIRPDILVIKDRDPNIKQRLWRHKDAIQSDFILWAQADEVWPDELGCTIRKVLLDNPYIDGLRIPHMSFNFGVSFGIGWLQLRIFRRKSFTFSQQANIHEMPSVPGGTLELSDYYLHYSTPNLLIFIIKNYKYNVIGSMSGVSPSPKWLINDKIPFWQALYFWMVLSKIFILTTIKYRNKGLAGFLYANAMVVGRIEQVCVPAEVQMLKSNSQKYEMAGHTVMPDLFE